MSTTRELGIGFTHLVELDQSHVEPLRQAVQKTVALRRSRNLEDLPATVKSLDAAAVTLSAYELGTDRQRKGLTNLTTALKGLDMILAARQPIASKQPSLLSNTLQTLQRLNTALTARAMAIHQLREYVETCAVDGHQAIRDR